VVLPGSRSTANDLAWLREQGVAGVIQRRASAGRPVLGICGGYQMLGHQIEDDVEGRVGVVPGLGLLPIRVTFGADKILTRPTGWWRGHRVEAYEIHHGRAHLLGAAVPTIENVPGAQARFLDGFQVGAVWGTMWHGAFENDGFRRAWLTQVAEAVGSRWRPRPDAPGFGTRRELMIDTLADALERHVDVGALLAMTRAGSPVPTT
jgi:adenosylcobyric acid synthase